MPNVLLGLKYVLLVKFTATGVDNTCDLLTSIIPGHCMRAVQNGCMQDRGNEIIS